MHKALATPITVTTQYGPISCTHEAFGMSENREWTQETTSVQRVIGVLVTEDGKQYFRAVPAPEHEKVKQVDVHSKELDTIYAEIQRILALP